MHLEIRKSLLNQEWDSYREQAKNGASVRRETSFFHHKKTFRLSQNVGTSAEEGARAQRECAAGWAPRGVDSHTRARRPCCEFIMIEVILNDRLGKKIRVKCK